MTDEMPELEWPNRMYLLHPSVKTFGDMITNPEREEYVRASTVKRLEEALRAIQTYLAEPAPEDKVNDLKGDLRWISHRVNAALQGVKT